MIEETLKPAANYNRYIASYHSDGLKIYALLTIPQGTPPPSGWPVILFNHGYIPPEGYSPTGYYVTHVAYLALVGYIVFMPDFRGNGKSEGQPLGAYETPDYVVDDLNALSALQHFPQADSRRIGMFGHSMGGRVARTLASGKTTSGGPAPSGYSHA